MKYVAIVIHGNYLSVGGGTAVRMAADIQNLHGTVRADGTGIGSPSIFERVDRAEARISLRMLDGSWVARSGNRLSRTLDEGAAEIFTEVRWPDDRFSLRAENGFFVCAEGGGGGDVVVDRSQAGEWEKFFYGQVPAELVPADENAELRGRVSSGVVDAVRGQERASRIDVSGGRRDDVGAGGASDTASGTRRRFP